MEGCSQNSMQLNGMLCHYSLIALDLNHMAVYFEHYIGLQESSLFPRSYAAIWCVFAEDAHIHIGYCKITTCYNCRSAG